MTRRGSNRYSTNVRWTERSADELLQFKSATPADSPREAETISAVLATHRSALSAVRQAHQQAAKRWQDARWTKVAGVTEAASDFHQSRHSANQEKLDLLDQLAHSGTPRLSADDLEKLQVTSPRPRGAAMPAGQLLAEALLDSSELPDGEHGISRPPMPLRVGIISASDWELAFSDVAEKCIRITEQNWQDHVGEVDLLLIPAEQQVYAPVPSHRLPSPPTRRLLAQEIIPAFRTAGVPAVLFASTGLQAKNSLDVARECTCVVTLDDQITATYQKHLGDAHPVYTVSHPVSPLRHTPLGTRPGRSQAVGLIDAGRPRKAPHLDSDKHLPALLDGALASGRPVMLIPPRHVQDPRPGDWGLPPRYTPWIITRERFGRYINAICPGRDPEMVRSNLQRSLEVGLSVQPVQNSQGLFDPEVLQLMASGTMVMTTYNQGINSYYPQAYIANSAEDVAKTLETLSEADLRQVQNDGVRAVFTSNHAVDVLARVAQLCGLDIDAPEVERVVAVTPETTDELRREISEQTHRCMELVTWSDLATRNDEYLAQIDVLVPVSPQRHYAPTYVADHVAAFRYQGSSVTTKLSEFSATNGAQGYRHVTSSGDAFSLDLSAWWRPSSVALRAPETLQASLSTMTPRVYELDHTGHYPAEEALALDNYNSHTRSSKLRRPLPDAERGTDLETAKAEFRAVATENDLKLAVIVPIYNNGNHLRHKAFASLRRSCMFDQMHILLINDGSTDPVTMEIVEELAHTWPNVSAFHHPRGGSGSASRPRNTGLELSFTPYVTYLDPDDEELEDGYWELMEKLESEPEAEFALGTQAQWTHDYSELDCHSWYHGTIPYREGLYRPHRQTLAEISFRPASIESIVARTEWLKSLGLVQPVGAVGQDTYFFQQMLYYTTAYAAVYRPVYTYYGAVQNSIVNVVSPGYFRKYLILETARAAWLNQVGLMETYKKQRFEHFFNSWYLSKLKRVAADQYEEAVQVLREIVDQYGEIHWSSWKSRRLMEGDHD